MGHEDSMNKKELKNKIYRSLKTGEKTIEEIQLEIGTSVSKKDIAACLDQIIKDGWVERTARVYSLIHVLGSPIDITRKSRDWDYEKIQEFQEAKERPVKWMNPFVEVVPHCDQGSRGTCCGFAGKYASWLKQLELVDPKPDFEEVKKIEYDQSIQVFGQCTMKVDLQHYMAPSAQGLYMNCRKAENVTHPTGCWIRGVVKAWKAYGYNYEKDWNTPKTSTCAPRYYPLKGTEEETIKFLEKQAAEHKIDGYAQALSWDALKDAIYNYGCALIAINMYENCKQNGKVGVLPEPDGECIGSHALCAVGYDEYTIWFLHSWRGGWAKINGISQKYYDYACGPAYIPIDSVDVGIAKEIYGVVNISSNVRSELWIGKDKYVGTSAKSSIELEKDYEIVAVPVLKNSTVEVELKQTIRATKEKPDVSVSFVFTEKTDKYGWIKKLIQDILKKIFK